MRKALTEMVVRSTKAPAKGVVEIHDLHCPGLVLRIGFTGHRSFVVRGRVRGRLEAPIRYTIGRADLYSLSEARQKAREALRAMAEGIDPSEQKRAQAASIAASVERQKVMVFSAVAERYIADHLAGLRTKDRVAADIRRVLVKAWGKKQADSIDAEDVNDLVRGIVKQGHSATAIRVLTVTKHLFKWACSPARPREERLLSSPAANLSAKDFGLKPAQRQVVLSDDQIRSFWQATDTLTAPWDGYFKLLLLSGQRRGEIARLRWDWVNWDEQIVVFPASVMKAKRAHELPLTAAMLGILNRLREQPCVGPYVFSTTGGRLPIKFFHQQKTRLSKIAGNLPDDWGIHDLRRTVRTHLSAIPGIPVDIRERVIAHVPPQLVGTYDVHDHRPEKRRALELWNARLMRIVEGGTAGKVVAFGR